MSQAMAVPESQVTPFKQALAAAQSSLEAALPRHIRPGDFVRLALVDIRANPGLAECTLPSVMASLMDAARLGLKPGPLGHCYLLPFNTKVKGQNGQWGWEKQCKLIPGYKGLVELARRSGLIAKIESRVVHEMDDFEVAYHMDPPFRHSPNLRDRGPVVGVYAVAKTTEGEWQFEFMTRDEVEAIRERSKSRDNGPWVTDWSEMARKTVVRRLCKMLPLSVEMHEALVIDQANDGLRNVTPAEAPRVSSAAALIGRSVRSDDVVDTTADSRRPDPTSPEDLERIQAAELAAAAATEHI